MNNSDITNKKRQVSEMSTNSDTVLTLLKRLHLDKTSELYENSRQTSPSIRQTTPSACTLSGMKTSTFYGTTTRRSCSIMKSPNKRLSTITEYDGDLMDVMCKRRRLDSEIANELSSSLFISKNKKNINKPKKNKFSFCTATDEDTFSSCTATDECNTDNLTSSKHLDEEYSSMGGSDNLSIKVNVNLQCANSLENTFIEKKLKESCMQLILWTPPPILKILETSPGLDGAMDAGSMDTG